MKEHQLLDHNADSIETSRFFSPKTTGGGVGLQTSVGLVFHKGFDLQVFEAFVYSSPQMNAYLNFMTVHREFRIENSEIPLSCFHSYEISAWEQSKLPLPLLKH